MKTFKFLYVVVIVSGLFFSCNKSEELPPDNIIFTEINKTITLSNPDSILGTCKDLIFEIKETNSFENAVIIRLNDELILCDGFNNILSNSDNGNVLTLDENQKVSDNDNWKSANGICLDEFAGKGEKYIGYRSGFFPSGVTNYNYGWIKIELSSDKKTLKIIDRATNYTENKYIQTGQIE
jgi:hypothetical protein